LPGNKNVDFTLMVFVIGEAFVYLRAGEGWKAVGDEGIDCLSVLQKSNDIMDSDAGALDERMAGSNAGSFGDIPIGPVSGTHVVSLRCSASERNGDHEFTLIDTNF